MSNRCSPRSPRGSAPRRRAPARALRGISAALLASAVLAGAARADLLVVAPHPDDDIITSSGVALRARQAGETVWIVFMTNGDIRGEQSGRARQTEAVLAQQELLAPEDNLIFLGYPDGYLADLRDVYAGADTALTGSSGLTTTYGERGLGRADYHRYAFGVSADNNGENVRTDLTHILSTYQPSDIFVTSEFDEHPDHHSTYAFVLDAVSAALADDPSYNPTVHKTIVWNDSNDTDAWPEPASPTSYFIEPPGLAARSGLVWSARESLDVPLEIQTTMFEENLKWRAVAAHASQDGNDGYIGQFLHKDEFFWSARARGTNRPPVPNAGADRAAGQGADVSLDASHSFDPDGDTLRFQWRQSAGPRAPLSSPGSAQPVCSVPPGASVGTVLVFELKVSDGTSTSVADAVSVRIGRGAPPPVDAGSPPIDAGAAPGDAAAPDAGVLIDAAAAPIDAGGTPIHPGDAAAPRDASQAAVDASQAAVDAATVPGEAGAHLGGSDAGALDAFYPPTPLEEDTQAEPPPEALDPEADDPAEGGDQEPPVIGTAPGDAGRSLSKGSNAAVGAEDEPNAVREASGCALALDRSAGAGCSLWLIAPLAALARRTRRRARPCGR